LLYRTTPVGVASLIAKTIASTSDIGHVIEKLGVYFLCVIVALVVWAFIVLPLIFFIVCRRNPYRFIGSIVPPIMIVFATGST